MRRGFWLIGAVLLGVAPLAWGQLLFAAFTGEDPIPNRSVEDPQKWNDNVVTPGILIFDAADGRLKQTADGCGATSKVLFPEVDMTGWSDYTVAFNAWWRDDDGIAIIFRYQGEDRYYSYVAGGADGHYSHSWFLGPAIFKEGVCFLDQGGNPFDRGPLGLAIDNTGNTGYTMMLRVEGSKMEAYFGELMPLEDILAGKTPPKVGEFEDAEIPDGPAGIGVSTCPSDFANIVVYGPGGPLAVDPQGKLPTAWALLKALH